MKSLISAFIVLYMLGGCAAAAKDPNEPKATPVEVYIENDAISCKPGKVVKTEPCSDGIIRYCEERTLTSDEVALLEPANLSNGLDHIIYVHKKTGQLVGVRQSSSFGKLIYVADQKCVDLLVK